ncbi:hypothetical protein DFP73DRAFT_484514 [Morchella snyderi]|nr:hypothetical protein DFP73DRAFT_484514 [Morchella snyderi]
MFWGAICSDIKGSGYVWIPETVKEKETATQLLKIENDELETSAQPSQKTVPPTAKKRGRPPKRLTKEKTRKKGVKGIDWYRYRNLVLKPHLYPFFHKVKQQKGEAFVTEDGASPHSHYLLKEERDKRALCRRVGHHHHLT